MDQKNGRLVFSLLNLLPRLTCNDLKWKDTFQPHPEREEETTQLYDLLASEEYDIVAAAAGVSILS